MKSNKLFESIKENLNEAERYNYIDGANLEDEGYDCVYNSVANTDVIMILQELKRYFDESAVAAEDIIKNANSDPGVYNSDVEMLKFCSEKVSEMQSKIESTWE